MIDIRKPTLMPNLKPFDQEGSPGLPKIARKEISPLATKKLEQSPISKEMLENGGN